MSVQRSNDQLCPPEKNGSQRSLRSNKSAHSQGNNTKNDDDELTGLSPDLQLKINQQLDYIEALETLFEEYELNQELIVYDEILDTIEQAKRYHEIFLEQHQKIIQAWPPTLTNHKYFQDLPSRQERNVFNKLMRTMRRAQEHLKPVVPIPVFDDINAQNKINRRAPLPEIRLPKFDGDYSKWAQFKAIYEDLVKNREDISESSKLHYLKVAVSGTPADIISHLQPETGSVDAAWKVLTDRFENKRLVVQSHFERVYAMPQLKTRSAKSMHHMHTTISETLQALKLAKIEDTTDCMMVHHCTNLLDTDTREHWENHLNNTQQIPKLSQFLEFVSTRARVLEGMEGTKPSGQSAKSSSPSTSTKSTPRRTQGFSATQRTDNNNNARPSPTTWICDACDGSHHMSNCQLFQDSNLQRRVQIIKNKHLCYICLSRHNANNCRSGLKCTYQTPSQPKCNQRHHTMLHGMEMRKFFETKTEPHSTSGEKTEEK